MSVKPATDISLIKGYIEKQDTTLINQMLNGLDFVKDLTVLRNVRQPLALNKMTVDKGNRRLNTDIETAKGGRKWSKRVLTPQGGMKIIKMIPEEVREAFMAEMLDPNAKELPFAQWVWEQEFAKIAADLNDNFYLGENPGDIDDFDAADTYAVGDYVYFNEIVYKCTAITTAGQSPATHPAKWVDADDAVLLDGPGTIIAKEITASNLVVAGTGSFDHTTAYDAVLEMWDNVDETHKNKGMTLDLSFGAAQDLAININKEFGSGVGISNMDIEEGKSFIVKGTGGRLRAIPRTWMKASRRLIITHAGNLVVGMNQVGDVNKVGKVVETLHGYKAIVKWMLGAQFRDLENLYVNDQV